MSGKRLRTQRPIYSPGETGSRSQLSPADFEYAEFTRKFQSVRERLYDEGWGYRRGDEEAFIFLHKSQRYPVDGYSKFATRKEFFEWGKTHGYSASEPLGEEGAYFVPCSSLACFCQKLEAFKDLRNEPSTRPILYDIPPLEPDGGESEADLCASISAATSAALTTAAAAVAAALTVSMPASSASTSFAFCSARTPALQRSRDVPSASSFRTPTSSHSQDKSSTLVHYFDFPTASKTPPAPSLSLPSSNKTSNFKVASSTADVYADYVEVGDDQFVFVDGMELEKVIPNARIIGKHTRTSQLVILKGMLCVPACLREGRFLQVGDLTSPIYPIVSP